MRPVFYPVFGILFFILSGCQPNSSDSKDPWGLSQPIVSFSQPTGMKFTSKPTEMKAMGGAVANEESFLQFEAKDHGLKLDFESTCQDRKQKLAVKGETTTSEPLFFAALLPPESLSPKAMMAQSKNGVVECEFNFRAHGPNHSFHKFKLGPIRVVLPEPKPVAADVLSQATESKGSKISLHCDKWWRDEAAPKPGFSIGQRLNELVQAEVGERGLRRGAERRPTCNLIEKTNSRVNFLGVVQPALRAPLVSVTRTRLFGVEPVYDIHNRALYRWTIRNDENTEQIYAIRHSFGMRIAFTVQDQGGWTSGTNAPFGFQVSGAESFDAGPGTYLRVPAKSEARVDLVTRRAIGCQIDFRYPIRVLLALPTPITFESLSNLDTFSPNNGAALHTAPRDELGTKALMLDSTLIIANGNADIADAPTAPQAVLAGAKLLPSTYCHEGYYLSKFPVSE